MSIRPMTNEERKSLPKEVLIKLEPSFDDGRGKIQPLVNITMESCVLITSNKGTIRANHYHKTDWHFCYVIQGSIEYYHRPVGSSESPKKVIIKQGELFFTPPMEEHAMVFKENTIFLTLGRNSRAQEVYESDVVRTELVTADMAFK